MAVTSAKWLRDPDGELTTIRAVIDGQEMQVPAVDGNRHYAEIRSAEFRREITIEPPDPEPEPTVDLYGDLSPAQFEWMLSYYELENIWSSVVGDAKGTHKGMYANLKAQQKRAGYVLQDTLYLMQQVRDRPPIQNSGVDLSDDAIKRYWRHAAVQDFASLTDVVPEPPIPETGETE